MSFTKAMKGKSNVIFKLVLRCKHISLNLISLPSNSRHEQSEVDHQHDSLDGSEQIIDLDAEIRAMINEAGPGDDLELAESRKKRKPVTSIISSPGYIAVLKDAKEKKEAEEKKKKERRQKRLESAETKVKEAEMRLMKIQKQVADDKMP